MIYYNRFGTKRELTVSEGDRVEIIKRSDIYCINDEEPIYHSGTITKIDYEDLNRDPEKEPIGIWVKFDKDNVFNDGEEEFIALAEIEELFKKMYDIVGYAMVNEGVTLSITGDGIGKIINFDYQNGDLIPVSIQGGTGAEKGNITENDEKLIQEVKRYGTPQKYFHYVLTQSK
ncbi:hypothetical protein [Bacillus sp. AFS088145]|uniref:hypothetical protein n=1 Tax=Bacillus sp. AFS088145 TaxID=2033514 RepID=UPI000BF81840|nr:hypothetical protein [Bacillus sp. AFS088145]PFH82627.1 hypothetical protein COI44_20005 [Bacillus sp. AFS088145]